ncbi:MAG: hypothetical protein AB8U61_04690 [Rickettsiales endosymbiont of Dermacentor nuttalli]
MSSLYDHVSGGFHRYTIDASWHTPHFEKMLYNQSLLSNCYLEAYSITKNSYYKYILDSTLKFVQSSFQNEAGGFYSSIDAETNNILGEYYIWNRVEIRSVLTPKQAQEFFSYFDIEIMQDCAESSINKSGVLFCYNGDIQSNYTKLKVILEKLYKVRTKRKNPNIDVKIITSWHSVMTTTYANAGLILNNVSYIELAKKSAKFLVENCINEKNELVHIVGNESREGFAEDYVYAVQALLAIYHVIDDKYWFQIALDLLNKCNSIFLEEDVSYVYSNKTNNVMRLNIS